MQGLAQFKNVWQTDWIKWTWTDNIEQEVSWRKRKRKKQSAMVIIVFTSVSLVIGYDTLLKHHFINYCRHEQQVFNWYKPFSPWLHETYKYRNSGFLSVMEQNTSSSEYQKSLPSCKVVQRLEHTLKNLADMDIEGPSEETWRVCNLFCPISPSTLRCPLEKGMEWGKWDLLQNCIGEDQLICLPSLGIFKPIIVDIFVVFFQFKWYACELARCTCALSPP